MTSPYGYLTRLTVAWEDAEQGHTPTVIAAGREIYRTHDITYPAAIRQAHREEAMRTPNKAYQQAKPKKPTSAGCEHSTRSRTIIRLLGRDYWMLKHPDGSPGYATIAIPTQQVVDNRVVFVPALAYPQRPTVAELHVGNASGPVTKMTTRPTARGLHRAV